jgi:hypothetical protein
LSAETVLWSTKCQQEQTRHHFVLENCTLDLGQNSAAIAFIKELFLSRQDRGAPCPPKIISAELKNVRIAVSGGESLFPAGKLDWQDAGNILVGVLSLGRQHQSGDTPLEIRVVREWSGQTVLAYGVHTGSGGLPADLLSSFFAGFEPFGRKTSFEGYIWVVLDSEAPQTELAGTFHIPEVGEIMGGLWGPIVRGRAQLLLRKCKLRGNRWQEGEGTFRLESGEITHLYVRHLWQSLGLHGGTATEAIPEVIPLEELAFHFAYDFSGVQVAGACAEGQSGTLLRSSQIVLATPPVGLRLSWAQLLASLLPPGQVFLPGVPEVAPLIARLPPDPGKANVATGRKPQMQR